MIRLALVVATAALVAVVAGAPSSSSAAPPAGPTVEVMASRGGFQPSSITIRKGETVRVVLTSSDGEHCFAIDDLRVEKRIVPGRPTRFDLTADRAGAYPFHCCLESGPAAEKERGQLTVAE